MPESKPGMKLVEPGRVASCDALAGSGYEFRFVVEESWGFPSHPKLLVEARLNGAVVGNADFAADGPALCHCNNVAVSEPRRRKGIASTFYELAEFALGRTLFDFWWDDKDGQSGDAKALWANPKRRFDHR